MYAKIENGVFKFLKMPIVINNRPVVTNDPELIISSGYKQVVKTDPPAIDDSHEAVSAPPEDWIEDESSYIQTWNIVEKEPDLIKMLEEIL